MAPTLLHLPYSPWSEKARWALDHHAVNVRRRVYLPIFEEPLLRLRLKQRGKVTLPVLLKDDEPLTDSLEIARWAEAQGSGESLFFDDRAVQSWNDKSEDLLATGRARATFRVAQDEAALRASVPPPFSKMPVVSNLFGRLGVRFLAKKYVFDEETAERGEQRMRTLLDDLRGSLRGGYLLEGRFSYADIAMAAALTFVEPPARRYSKLAEANQNAFRDPTLAKDYSDLVQWRDELYEKHRKK